MKKTLAILLALVFVLSIAGTALAAPANPFVDVPAKHWSYDAVSKLAKAGIVDGYGDGTFRGDKTMTRYEMAQIVAKAMARSDKADASMKALIDKLAVEFAAELNNLGVRVAKLEANQPTIKFGGTFQVRYTDKDDPQISSLAAGGNQVTGNGNSVFENRLRWEATAKVDDTTYVGLRIVNDSPQQNVAQSKIAAASAGAATQYKSFALPTDQTWQKWGNDGSKQTAYASVDRMWIGTKSGALDLKLGRQALAVGTTGIMVDSPAAFSYDAFKVNAPIGSWNGEFSYGRLPGGTASSVTVNPAQFDVATVQFSTTYGKFVPTFGFFNVKNKANDYNGGNLAANVTSIEPIKTFWTNLTYNFQSNLQLVIETGENKAAYATRDNKFLAAFLTYGDLVMNKKGANNVQLRYYTAGVNAIGGDSGGNGLYTFNSTPGYGNGNRATMWNPMYNYAFSSMFNLELDYFAARCADRTQNYNAFRAVVTAKF